MAFQFSLDSVLRLRRSEQRQQELILHCANEQVSRVAGELENLRSEARRIRSDSNAQARITAAEIQFDQLRCEILAVRCAETTGRLLTVQERRTAALKEFQRVWQNREVLDTLREHERQAYALEESRREQRAQDDLFLQRRTKR
jgi:flagellar export protein FliJ